MPNYGDKNLAIALRLQEIAKETERAEFQYNEDALLKKKAEIDNISQKKISTEEKLASVKKLAKKADDRNQHLSLEAVITLLLLENLIKFANPCKLNVTKNIDNFTRDFNLQNFTFARKKYLLIKFSPEIVRSCFGRFVSNNSSAR